MRRVGLLGAGFISRVHAEALQSIPTVKLTAIVDPREANAEAVARQFGIAQIFTSVERALEANAFDCAHVLVPPDLHASIAEEIIAAGKPVLLEKPMAEDTAQCQRLLRQAADTRVTLGVNQNFVFHPAFRRLASVVKARELGRPNHINCRYNVPLRQIAARQFGHWMFGSARNLLLEQAVHPLSQVMALAGAIRGVRLIPGSPIPLPDGQTIYPSLDAIMHCERYPASLRFAVGQPYPLWQLTLVCDDGIATADILSNRFFMQRRSRWIDTVDGIVSSTHIAAALVGGSIRNTTDYSLSLLRLKPRSDAFYRSMRDSIASFHAALDANRPPELDGSFGADLVSVCEQMAREFGAPPPRTRPTATPINPAPKPDLAILGGTGFIGAHLVRLCVERGLRVAVMARNTLGLSEVFRDPHVTVLRGDIRDADAVAAAIGDAPTVVNLAHGGGGNSWDEVREAMVGGAETVARACLAANVKRLIHVGSIARLYLGPQPRQVTGATDPDPQAERRADYARAKAVCDRLLLDMRARLGLPVVILRPGVVVGDGGPALHGELGFFNNDQHCIGWNDGRNPLPFVLVEDVADAILRAAQTDGIEGRCYNLVGDVWPSAREYIASPATALERPLQFHSQSPVKLWAAEICKWAIKRASGRRAPLPSLRDILSRGMKAQFDCRDTKRDLGLVPVDDPTTFEARAIRVHAG